MKRVVRKPICFSTPTQMHDMIIGLFVNRYAFGLLVYNGYLHISDSIELSGKLLTLR
jgi:hypothetical protein